MSATDLNGIDAKRVSVHNCTIVGNAAAGADDRERVCSRLLGPGSCYAFNRRAIRSRIDDANDQRN